jgi:hypothetical protein
MNTKNCFKQTDMEADIIPYVYRQKVLYAAQIEKGWFL